MPILSMESLSAFFAGRRRFHLAWVFVLLLIASATRSPSAVGTTVVFLGAALRIYASGFLRKEAALAVGGPYAFTRNPLYLGSFVMGIGAAISVSALSLALLLTLVFFLNHHFVIDFEERKLPTLFGPRYDEYRRLVPRFLPTVRPPSRAQLTQVNADPAAYRFSAGLAWRNKAYESVAIFLGIVFGLMGIVMLKRSVGLL